MSTNYQFKHQNSKQTMSGTFALLLPKKQELLDLVSNGQKQFNVLLGATFLHPKDQFVKSVGRELAVSKLTNTEFRLRSVTFRNKGRVVYNFSTVIQKGKENKSVYIDLGVSFLPDCETRLEYLSMNTWSNYDSINQW